MGRRLATLKECCSLVANGLREWVGAFRWLAKLGIFQWVRKQMHQDCIDDVRPFSTAMRRRILKCSTD